MDRELLHISLSMESKHYVLAPEEVLLLVVQDEIYLVFRLVPLEQVEAKEVLSQHGQRLRQAQTQREAERLMVLVVVEFVDILVLAPMLDIMYIQELALMVLSYFNLIILN